MGKHQRNTRLNVKMGLELGHSKLCWVGKPSIKTCTNVCTDEFKKNLAIIRYQLRVGLFLEDDWMLFQKMLKPYLKAAQRTAFRVGKSCVIKQQKELSLFDSVHDYVFSLLPLVSYCSHCLNIEDRDWLRGLAGTGGEFGLEESESSPAQNKNTLANCIQELEGRDVCPHQPTGAG